MEYANLECDDMQIGIFSMAFREAPAIAQLCEEGDAEAAEAACESGAQCAPEGSFDSLAECIIQVMVFDIRAPGTSQCIVDAGEDCEAALMCLPEGAGDGEDGPGMKGG
jgi:hypothetical protein